MINIAICDDKLSVVKSIAKILESAIMTCDFEAEIDTITTSQDEIYSKIKEHLIDILFLDIDFNDKGKNGIEFALELRKMNKDFKLIFITSYFEYGMIAYKCKTFDYLLKPLDIEKVTYIVNRLKDDVSNKEIGLFKINKDYSLKTRDILYIERNKSKATIYTKDSTYETCFSLNNLEKELPSSFIRVHRSYIINCEQITKINKEEKAIYFSNSVSCPMGNFNIKL